MRAQLKSGQAALGAYDVNGAVLHCIKLAQLG